MRPATHADQPALDGFLCDHLGTSMFLLSNLRPFGPMGGEYYRAMRFWISEEAGRITGTIALSTTGVVMPQLPLGDWDAARDVLRGEEIEGIIGDGGQVAALRAALGLDDAPTHLWEEETLFELPLSDLTLPDTTGLTLAPLADWKDVALDWRKAYHAEVLGTPADKIDETAKRDIEGSLNAASHRVLLRDGAPVAMTGFNAALKEAVQVGGVYTPPALRGQHLARSAVGLHLAEARDRGVPHAILFAVAPDAIRAYESLGFRPTGRFSLVIFRDLQGVA